ncbi:DUF6458 family protein [Paraconexibacter sp.]|uniref:DUF6458 family protein n=1 Tax=Paraconexibacter sp. TaxID=2949640 RepID=UPI0035614252
MQIGTSIFLLALGAILKFAVTDAIDGVDLTTVGLILMIVGALGLVISMFMTSQLRDRATERTVVRERHDQV